MGIQLAYGSTTNKQKTKQTKPILTYDRTELVKSLNYSRIGDSRVADLGARIPGCSVQSLGMDLGVLENIQFQQKL